MTSTADLHAKALAFLGGVFALESHQSCVKIELTYAPSGGYRQDPIKTWVPESSPELFGIGETAGRNHVFVERLVAEILELAENHADSYGQGRHRFVVRSHQHLGGRQTHAFVILPSFDGEDNALVPGGGVADLQPTQAGIVSQLMRHLETRDRNQQVTLQTMLGAVSHHAQQMREENADLRAQLAAKDQERMQWLTTIEEARSKEHERQIEAQVVVGREERKTNAAKKIVNLLPVALSKWLGSGKAEPGKEKPAPSPLAQLVGKLLFSMTDPQRSKIQAILSMEQGIMLTEIVEVVKNGDSVLLSSMLHDLTSSLTARQVTTLMESLTPEQQVMFVQAIKLAQVQAEPEPGPDDKKSKEAGGSDDSDGDTKTTRDGAEAS